MHAPPSQQALLDLPASGQVSLAGGDTETKSAALPVRFPPTEPDGAARSHAQLTTVQPMLDPSTGAVWDEGTFQFAGVASFGILIRSDPGALSRLHCRCSIGSNVVRSTRRIVTQKHAMLHFLRPPPATFLPSTEYNLQRLDPAPVAMLVDQFGDLVSSAGVNCRADAGTSPSGDWWVPSDEAVRRGAMPSDQISVDILNQPQAGVPSAVRAAVVAPLGSLSSLEPEPKAMVLLPGGQWRDVPNLLESSGRVDASDGNTTSQVRNSTLSVLVRTWLSDLGLDSTKVLTSAEESPVIAAAPAFVFDSLYIRAGFGQTISLSFQCARLQGDLSVSSEFELSARVSAALWREKPPEVAVPRVPFRAAVDLAALAKAPTWWTGSAEASQSIQELATTSADTAAFAGAPRTQSWLEATDPDSEPEPGLLALQVRPASILSAPQPWRTSHPSFDPIPAQTSYGSTRLPARRIPWFAENTGPSHDAPPAVAYWQLIGQLSDNDADLDRADAPRGLDAEDRISTDRIMPKADRLLGVVGLVEPNSIVEAMRSSAMHVADTGAW